MPTIGEERVGLVFSASSYTVVDEIKRMAADLIDLCEDFKKNDALQASLAQSAFKEGAMWAVKAATAGIK